MKDLCRRLCPGSIAADSIAAPAVSARAQDCFAVETAESAMMAGQGSSCCRLLWKKQADWRGVSGKYCL